MDRLQTMQNELAVATASAPSGVPLGFTITGPWGLGFRGQGSGLQGLGVLRSTPMPSHGAFSVIGFSSGSLLRFQ